MDKIPAAFFAAPAIATGYRFVAATASSINALIFFAHAPILPPSWRPKKIIRRTDLDPFLDPRF
jgi:hypothetical protein